LQPVSFADRVYPFQAARLGAVGQPIFRSLRVLAWSVALIYMVVGPAYRLSLMGALARPSTVQAFLALAPIDIQHRSAFR
jgi:hypothetical protein